MLLSLFLLAFKSTSQKGKKGGPGGGNKNDNEPFNDLPPILPGVIGLTLVALVFSSFVGSENK